MRRRSATGARARQAGAARFAGRRAGVVAGALACALVGAAGPASAQPAPPPNSPPSAPLQPSLRPSILPNLTAPVVASRKPEEQERDVPLPAGAEGLPKKDRELLGKRARAALGSRPPGTAVGVKPAPILNLFHRWTQEVLPIELTSKLPDRLPSAALQNRLLRDHYTNQATAMATRLIPAIVAAARAFHVQRADIVSGYRHPKYNLILRKKGHQVARDSEHSHGQAVDFRLPGVTTEKLAAWALARRMGGVGIYLQSQFVHIDVGKVRRWSGE